MMRYDHLLESSCPAFKHGMFPNTFTRALQDRYG